LTENDRIIGGTTVEATQKAADFYRTFVKGKVLETDSKTAEMSKLAENTFRDINIAYANELSLLAEKYKVNAWEVIKLANHHPRVNIHRPGVGVGGHCISVDPWFLITGNEGSTSLMHMARIVNKSKTEWVVERIKKKADIIESKKGKKVKIACLGLAYKPDIDDLRESPALEIVRKLIHDGYEVLPVEPNLASHPEFKLEHYNDAIKQADFVAILVGHTEFKSLKGKNVLDFVGTKE